MFIHVTKRELQRSFRNNLQASGAVSTAPATLLLIYALESGMKSEIMAQRGADHTAELSLIQDIGHDLRECLKELRAPASLSIRATSTRQKTKQHILPASLHTVFRYGVDVDDIDGVVGDLKGIRDWLIERMR